MRNVSKTKITDEALCALAKVFFVFCIIFFSSSFIGHSQTLIKNNGATISVSQGATVIVKTSSILNSSGHLRNAGDLIVEGNITNNDTITGMGNASVFELVGNWVNNNLFVPGEGIVKLSGGNQLINGSQSTTFYKLFLEGTGIKTQKKDIVVINELKLNDRELAADTNSVFILNASSSSVIRTTGFVSNEGDGRLVRTMNSTNEYLFPVGSSTNGTSRYRPVEIKPSTTLNQTIAIRMANRDATLEGYNRNNKEPDICDINPLFFHFMERNQGVDPVNVEFFYITVEDGQWTGIAQWRNLPRWENTGIALADIDTPFSSLSLINWINFDDSPYALELSKPIIDSANVVLTHISCNGYNDGSIFVPFPPLSGAAPFTYVWSNGDSTDFNEDLTAGIYNLTVSDSFSCMKVYTFELTEPNPIVIDPNIIAVSCKGGADGAISLTVTGDFPPFSYQWSLPSGDTSTISGLEAGSYSVTVTDNESCGHTMLIAVTEPDLLVATATGIDVTCFGFDDGEGLQTVTGGILPYDYLWETDDSTKDVSGLIAGSYGVTVTDANDCIATSGIQIEEPEEIIVMANEDQTIAIGFSTEIEVVFESGGTGSISYEWIPINGLLSPNSMSTNASPDTTTLYLITLTDDNGCLSTDTVLVTVDVNLFAFPDAFVPNGSNNIFKPVLSPTVSLQELRIYNRWGQMLSSNPSGWDGKYNGELQPMDTYVYQSVINLPDGSKESSSGDFILIW